MTKRERVLSAINHKETDYVPYQIDLTYQAYERLTEYTGDPDWINKIGNHLAFTGYGKIEEMKDRCGYFQDQFGVVWNRTGADKDIGVIDDIILKDTTLDGYEFPYIDEKEIRAQCEALINSEDDKCKVFGIGFSMFERAWTLRGMENLLADMIMEPEFVHTLLNAICEHNLEVLRIALDYDFDSIYFGDDWGQQKGTIMGPNYWREFIKPYVAKMYAKVKEKDKFIIQHSCGDIEEIFPDLIEIGLDVYQTFQPEIYDIRKVKREFGKDLSFFGGMSTQTVLPRSTPEQVKENAKEIISIMKENGGYIASPTHAVPFDVPPENIIALAEVFQNQ
ncbi:MAG: uroporphyrinogen decarboxylase family protein [Armatimonadota bacterium]